MGRPGVLLPVVGASVVVALAGCGADVEREGAAAAADAFTASVISDPQAACALLAPNTVESVEDGGPCAQGLAQAGVTPAGARESVTVAGHSAQVRYTDDTVFLALFDDGWRVTAAGCRRTSPDAAVPYDCSVEGS